MAVRDKPPYPWYQIVEGTDFTQGDIIRDCPIPVPTPDEGFLAAVKEDGELDTHWGLKTASLIVLTQACDIEYSRVESIVLCPVWTMDLVAERHQQFSSAGGKEQMRKGQVHYFHLLKDDPELGIGHLVVDFRELYTLPTDFLRLVAAGCGERPRLLPPYREHLSQSFARYFMRVGLPIDIPAFR